MNISGNPLANVLSGHFVVALLMWKHVRTASYAPGYSHIVRLGIFLVDICNVNVRLRVSHMLIARSRYNLCLTDFGRRLKGLQLTLLKGRWNVTLSR